MLPRLYPILDSDLCRERRLEPLAVLAAFLAGGARFLQLRDKTLATADRLAFAEAVVARAHAAGARVIVNDRADIARLSGADGVHVGQDDLSVDEARRIVGADALVGISTHDEAQIDAAAATSASYIAVGPIYGTVTKDTGYSARGLDLVRHAAGQAGKPIVAIGGITLDRAAEVLAAGASSVAIISDLLRDDPATMVRAFRHRLGDAAPR
jgi:thiamine-phosphate pyrophosphorylase